MADLNDLSDLGGTPDDLSDLGGVAVPVGAEQSPVSDNDLSKFSGDSGQEALRSLGVHDDSGAGSAGLSGVAQGATFGGSDELGAAKDVALDVLTGKQGLDGLGTKWRELQKKREAANKADQEAHPAAYFAGELAGGVAASIPAPELGGAKLISMAGKLSPKVAAFLAKSTPEAMAIKEALASGKITAKAAESMIAAAPKAGAMAKIAGSGTKMAIEGAPAGALYGLGASEHDISDPTALAKDVASGTAMGSLGGLAIGTAAQTGKELINAGAKGLQGIDFPRKLGVAYNLGKEGVPFTGTEGQYQVAKLAKDIPHEISQQIMAADKQLGMAVGNSLGQAEQAGVRINIDPQLKQSAEETFRLFADNPVLLSTMDPKSKELIMKVSQSGLGDMSPLEARALKDTFADLTDKLSGLSSDVANIARQRGSSLSRALDQQLKTQVPEYAKAAAQFAQFRSSIPETLLQPELPADLRTKQLGSLKNKATDLYKGVSNVIGSAHMPGAPAVQGERAALGELAENLKKIEKTNPETVRSLGGSAEDVAQKWRDQADKMAVLRQSQGFHPHESIGKVFKGSLLGTGEGYAYGIANRAGQASKLAGQTGPVKAARSAYTASNDYLLALAQHLKTNKGSEPFGNALENALNNKDEMAKNAVLFKLLQIPEYRTLFNKPEDNQ